ncbi:hypothetical protein [Methylocucumis oryzae]|uniref:Uncharacterized protein n=1 Tax=Methylocucumis oryzae TaxID=1632867 RepID=A0A0F3IIK4_9GAMM|nr:hypothetical protein [Methylocucumis oryzae]KJV06507.1 hypothetical protein VZ94_10740 [Methylocucumis oryzae]
MQEESGFYDYLSKYLARIQAGLALLLLSGLCGFDFFFPTHYSLQAGIHGLSAIASVVFATLLTHKVYPLLRGAAMNLDSLRQWVLIATGLNLLGAISGNWIYMRYRGEHGPRDWILEHVPIFHMGLMEFKEFVSLFPFPLLVTASFILFYYRPVVQTRRDVTLFVAIPILLSWFFLVFSFVAGLVLAKLRFV